MHNVYAKTEFTSFPRIYILKSEMLFSKRQTKIIKILQSSDHPITGRELSSQLGTSLRSIQYDISSINSGSQIIVASKNGYIIKDSFVIKPVCEEETEDHILIKLLLDPHNELNIDELADSLYISTSTLINKLKSIQNTLNKYSLSVKREKGFVSIGGNEIDKRRFIKDQILLESSNSIYNFNTLKTYCDPIDADRIQIIIENIINKYGYCIEEPYRINIVVNVAIALSRIKNNKTIQHDNNQDFDHDRVSSRIAFDICKLYGEHWDISFSDAEVSYISTLFDGYINNSDSLEGREGIISRESLVAIVNEVFSSYLLDIDLSSQIESLLLHLNAMIKRIQKNNTVQNFLLSNIKRNCPFIYDVSVNISHKLGKRYNITIPEDEIGFICIHIGYLIDTTNNNEFIPVALIQNNYHSISKKLESKINEDFGDIIKLQNIASINEADPNTKIIITTKSSDLINGNVILMSPFYTDEDKTILELKIKNTIASQEKSYLHNTLLKYFSKDLFFIDDKMEDKESVLNYLCRKTIEIKIAPPEFTESVLKRESLSSTCFYNSFAIPHSLEMIANKTAVCVMISKKGINWDPAKIKLVMLICIREEDRDKFMELYNGMVKILKKPENVNRLIGSSSFDDFIYRMCNII